jgi:D-alanine-D-alanine ligase
MGWKTTKSKGPLTRLRIGVVMGGQSSEREISLKTGTAVHQALLRRGYDAVALDAAESLPEQLRKQGVKLAFLALHGPGGEDGVVQGFLEVVGIPYSGSGVRASAVAMHKGLTKTVLEAAGVPVAPGAQLLRGEQPIKKTALPKGLKWPVVTKPATQGSTIGISIVRDPSQWPAALRLAYRYDPDVLVETFIPGRELTVPVLDGMALPAVEIVAPEGFYDFSAKYRKKGETQYLCPAPIPARMTNILAAYAVKAYRAIGCDGAARIDFRLTPKGAPFVLEINTIPGMTETSLLPMSAASAGLDYDALCEAILQSALRKMRQGSEA